jgi:hypothetical protein
MPKGSADAWTMTRSLPSDVEWLSPAPSQEDDARLRHHGVSATRLWVASVHQPLLHHLRFLRHRSWKQRAAG